MNLFKYQQQGVRFLQEREGALLAWVMGSGKSRTALKAAYDAFERRGKNHVGRLLILCPASVRYAWLEELHKVSSETASFKANLISYKNMEFRCAEVLGALDGNPRSHLPVLIVSYAMLQQVRHVEQLLKWCLSEKTIMICDESSYLKTRSAKQTKGAMKLAKACVSRWLLSGTPVTNSPLDLWGQGEVMYPDRGRGPLYGFLNFYHFRSAFAELAMRKMGQLRFQEVVGYKNLPKLQKRFAPFTSRVEVRPPGIYKRYTVREVPLKPETWKVYKELKRDCLLALPDRDVVPEPNAAVRLLRLCQLTSGHVGVGTPAEEGLPTKYEEVSSEKLDWLFEQITEGELAGERALIVWCRWRPERERLARKFFPHKQFFVYEVFGGQGEKKRDFALNGFKRLDSTVPINRNLLLAQPHAGGYGLNLTTSHAAVYLSNDGSWVARAQSEDRIYRTGQTNDCFYIDVLATGPDGQRTTDHIIFDNLKERGELANWTCRAWRKALEEE